MGEGIGTAHERPETRNEAQALVSEIRPASAGSKAVGKENKALDAQTEA
jgi:hypothetical protein